MEQTKQRLDILMTEIGLATSREKAKVLVMSGCVFIHDQKALKPSQIVAAKDFDYVQVRGKTNPYVSRGGLKLEKALNVFSVDPSGKTAIDIGASTGGFTDCLLQHGAKRVYSIDVGYGQLDWKLRQDERVVVMERCNARKLSKNMFNEKVNFAVMDVSFISIKHILPVIKRCLEPASTIISLIKPQFEAGREYVGKKGVIRDAKIHQQVIEDLIEFSLSCGFTPLGLDFSPIKGPEGNIEFLLYACVDERNYTKIDCTAVVNKAHEVLL